MKVRHKIWVTDIKCDYCKKWIADTDNYQSMICTKMGKYDKTIDCHTKCMKKFVEAKSKIRK